MFMLGFVGLHAYVYNTVRMQIERNLEEVRPSSPPLGYDLLAISWPGANVVDPT